MILKYQFLSFLFISIPIVIFIFYVNFRKKEKALNLFIGKKFRKEILPCPSIVKIIIKRSLLVFALIFIIFALINPQYIIKSHLIKKTTLDIIFAIDVSASMLVKDVLPNRLQTAKRIAVSLIPEFKESNIGLVVFSGSAMIQVPLTLDHDFIRYNIDEINPDFCFESGTNFSDLLKKVIPCFIDSAAYKAVIIFSDGENLGNNPFPLLREVSKKNIHIFSVGIGKKNGSFIPIQEDSQTFYKKNEFGKLVVSSRCDQMLIDMSKLTNGDFFIDNQDFSITGLKQALIKSAIQFNKQQEFVKKMDIGPIFLFLAFFLLIIEMLISDYKN
ncbi:MAG: VWA domain-containing protein [Candidatus Margulisiibacteriota bacterium]|jgi:Ca-activated chloride channel family protein